MLFNFVDNPYSGTSEAEDGVTWIYDVLYGTNKKLRNKSGPWVQIIMCFVISMATILTVIQLRNSLKGLMYIMNPFKKELDTGWLHSHTLFFGGLMKNDPRGHMLEKILQQFLEKKGGKVLNPTPEEIDDKAKNKHKKSKKKKGKNVNEVKPKKQRGVFVQKSYQRLTEVMTKIEETEDMIVIQKDGVPVLRKCCTKNTDLSETYLRTQLEKLDSEVKELHSERPKSAFCGYVVLDSYESMLECIQEFQETIFDNCRIL